MRSCEAKGSKNPARVYSTKNDADAGLLYCLLCKKKGLPQSKWRVPQAGMREVEEEFGDCKFKMCRYFTDNLKKCMKGLPCRPQKRTVENDPPSLFVVNEDDSEAEKEVCELLDNDSPNDDNLQEALPAVSPSETATSKSSSRRSPRINMQVGGIARKMTRHLRIVDNSNLPLFLLNNQDVNQPETEVQQRKIVYQCTQRYWKKIMEI